MTDNETILTSLVTLGAVISAIFGIYKFSTIMLARAFVDRACFEDYKKEQHESSESIRAELTTLAEDVKIISTHIEYIRERIERAEDEPRKRRVTSEE